MTQRKDNEGFEIYHKEERNKEDFPDGGGGWVPMREQKKKKKPHFKYTLSERQPSKRVLPLL